MASKYSVSTSMKRSSSMRNETTTRVDIQARVWRDLGQLAAEAAMIGVLFSLLLAVAVFVMTRDNRGEATRPALVAPASQTSGMQARG